MANEAGAGCANRTSAISGYTFISQGAPASQGGSCNKLEVYITAGAEDTLAYFAFFIASGNSLTTVAGTRTNVTIPINVPASCVMLNAPGDFTAFSVNSGNYLGAYSQSAIDYATSGGSGLWYKSGDNTNVSGFTFSNIADGLDALSADIVAGGISIPIAMQNMRGGFNPIGMRGGFINAD